MISLKQLLLVIALTLGSNAAYTYFFQDEPNWGFLIVASVSYAALIINAAILAFFGHLSKV